MKKMLAGVEFWILIFLIIRLIGITNAPLEAGHNWRQATGLMVARNFLETDANILYPRIDENNGQSGIIAMEFPLLNYLHYSISLIWGYTHWYGRLINLIISSLGLLYFYRIISLAGFGERISFAATLFLASSIWFSFSRKMMPDTFSVSLMIIALYYSVIYLKICKLYSLILYTGISSLGLLSKIPALTLLIVLIPLLTNGGYPFQKRLALGIFTIFSLLLTYLWYFVWNKHLAAEFGMWYNIGKPFHEGFKDIITHLPQTFHKFYFDSFYSYIIFALNIAGVFILIIKKEQKMLIFFVAAIGVFLLYIIKSGYFFYHHNYYIIPFVPFMAILAGYALSQIKSAWIFYTLLILGIGEGVANQYHDFFLSDKEMYKLELEGIMDKLSKKTDLIAINGNGNPQLLYLAHRKGWNCSNSQLADTNYTAQLAKLQCDYIIVHLPKQEHRNKNKEIAFENAHFLIYRIKPHLRETQLNN